MHSATTTVEDYLAALPDDRREIITTLIHSIDRHLPPGFEQSMYSGMPAWCVPLSTFPEGYHTTAGQPLPFLAVASQKRHIAVYHMGLYADPELMDWFLAEYGAMDTGRRLDLGKSCIRFSSPRAVPIDLIARLAQRVTPQQWVEAYQRSRQEGRPGTGVRTAPGA